MRKALVPVMILMVTSLAAVAAEKQQKERTWQQGTLKEVSLDRGSRIVGAAGSGSGALTQKRDDATFYTIEAGDYTYVAKRTLTSRGDRQLAVTVNDQVKFAIEKEDFFLQDEQGKEHKLTLEKKIRNQK